MDKEESTSLEPVETTPEVETQPAQPETIMPDAAEDDVRAELQKTRREAAKYRTRAADLNKKLANAKSVEERLETLQSAILEQNNQLTRSEFNNLALQAGVDIDRANMLDLSKFDLSDHEDTLTKLAAFADKPKPAPQQKQPLPSAGRQVVSKKEKPLSVDDLASLSDEEFTSRLQEIVKLRKS